MPLASSEVMDLSPLISARNTFTLLQAPPAWGKTGLLLEQIGKNPGLWVFLSPLRALAEEFYQRCSSLHHCVIIRTKADWRAALSQEIVNTTVIVTTPECFQLSYLELLEQKYRNTYVIVDEFHLFYIWGHDFRFQMWQSLIDISSLGKSTIALSATISEEIKKSWMRDFALSFDTLINLDLGNYKWKHPPDRVHYFSSLGKQMLTRRFLRLLAMEEKDTLLYFCKYRSEVDAWVKVCRLQGVSALGCKGGETAAFLSELEKCPHPRAIFATSALAHGVNLPKIRKVFISYRTKRRDFWLQMAARGGRDGRGFTVYTLDHFHHPFIPQRIISILINTLIDALLRLRMIFWML